MDSKNILDKPYYYLANSNPFLTDDDYDDDDNDIYNAYNAPSDNRVWESYVEDIDGGDNFADYCKYIFNILLEEEYFEN